MKKNISINISGIIFHIEEDGYDTLRKYLDSITKYFSTFEDSSEIMADIESRIAEIFLSRLNEGKQVIIAEDVSALITTMGSVSDFKAAESDGTSASGDNANGPGEPKADPQYTYTPPKSLSRDQRRKILGGVCAGIGHYLNIDPLWIRLLFALFAFAWGVAIIVYIVMWIVVPGTFSLNEIEVGKKMYRDPEKKVLGGVAGGVASYLNIDLLAVRILFILLTLTGGLGIFLYIILWVILPEARTLTDRMQMQGELVTLSNIESNLKKNQLEPDQEENAITKILLFPFRLIAVLLQTLAKAIGPIAEALRMVIGIMIAMVGASLLLSSLATAGIAFGIISAGSGNLPGFDYSELSIPLDAFMRAFPGWVLTAAFVAFIIPSLFIILLGISVIASRVVFSAPVGWSLFALLMICILLLGAGIPKIVMAFKEEGEVKIETNYTSTGKQSILTVRETGMDNYHGIRLHLKGHHEKSFKLVQVFKAQGNTRKQAIENTRMVEYNVSVTDSVFTFDSNITFKPDAIFRAQELKMTLYIPFNKPFILEKSMENILENYFDYDSRDGETWQMTEEKGLTCISCPQPAEEDISSADLHDFDQVDLHGIFDVRIYRGDEYSVALKGNESDRKKYNIFRTGKTLVVEYEGKKKFNWDWNFDKVMHNQVYISITLPDLERIEATGFGRITFEEFKTNDMDIEIRGPIKVKGKLHVEDLTIDLNGKSEADLEGTAHSMRANIRFASKLKAANLEVQEGVLEVRGASLAKVNVIKRLELEEGVVSDVDNRGNAEIIKRR